MKLAVLLLQNSDSPRATTFDEEWVRRLLGHTVGYLGHQAGGRITVEVDVFDWFTLPMTAAQWDQAAFEVGPMVRPMVEAGLGVDLSSFDHFALVIDRADARLAAVSPVHPEFVHVAAQDMDAALLQHEIGHFYGAGHANLDSPSGPVEYGDAFCVMGAEGAKFSFVFEPLNLTDPFGGVSTTLSDSGPGMVAPTLLACAWLEPGHGTDLTGALQGEEARAVVRLVPLRGAPRPGVADQVFAFAHGLLDRVVTVELRWRDGWDQGLPDPGADSGWVVVHSTRTLSAGTDSVQLAALPARVGATTYVPAAGLGVEVVEVDTAGKTASVALEVERFPSRYASVWEPSDGVPWQARHGLSPADYQQVFTELATQGYRLVDVDVHSSKARPRFAGIWRREDGPAWQARHGLTGQQYQQTFDEMTATGFRPVCVSGYADGGQALYAAVWTKSGGPAWTARHGLSADQYQQLFEALPGQGFRPVRLNVSTVSGHDLFSVIWHQSEGSEWLARHGLSAQEYQQLFSDLAGQGWRLLDVSGYGSGGHDRYACLWNRPGGPFEARHGLSPFLHQQEFTALTARGQRPVRVSGHDPFG